jgi:hypothetical protein
VPEKKLYLLQFYAIHMAKPCACSPEIMRCEVSELQTPRAAPDYILDGVSDMPDPQAVPCRLTALKTRPVVTDAAVSHLSTALFTQIGMGTVRTWLPLPTRSTITQWPCRICMSSCGRADSSARRKPQPSRIDIIATSRIWRKPCPSAFSSNNRA